MQQAEPGLAAVTSRREAISASGLAIAGAVGLGPLQGGCDLCRTVLWSRTTVANDELVNQAMM